MSREVARNHRVLAESTPPDSISIDSASTDSTSTRGWLLAGLLVAFGLRMCYLDGKSLWLDEVLTYHTLEQGLAALWNGRSELYHPPLYYWLLDLWGYFGDGVYAMRLLSALFGFGAVVAAYLLGNALFGRAVATMTLWLVALSPLLVWYSQEMRNYSLLILLALLSLLGFVQINQPRHPNRQVSSGSKRFRYALWWCVFVLATGAALYTHYVAFILLPMQVALLILLHAAGRATYRSAGWSVLGWGAIVLLYIPWMQTPGAQGIVTLLQTHPLWTAVPLLPFRTGGTGSSFRLTLAFLLCGFVFSMILLYWFFRWFLREPRPIWRRLRENRVVQGLLIGAFVAFLVLSVIPRGFTLKRYFSVLTPMLLILFGWVWAWKPGTLRLRSILLSLSLLAAVVTVFFIPKTQWRETVRFVAESGQAGDIVLLSPHYMTFPFDYYFDYYGRDAYNEGGMSRSGVRGSINREQFNTLIEDHERVWVIEHTIDVGNINPRLDKWLQESGQEFAHHSFYQIELRLYELP